jgi:hypothetical protein
MIEDLKKAIKDKRILIISPKFFGYENRIIKRLNELGAEAIWIDDRIDNSVLSKLIMRYFPLLYKNKVNAYYKRMIKSEFDIILAISPESLSRKFFFRLKKKTKASKAILYLWDSISNKKRAKPIINCFDKCLTFDPDDAKKYNFIFRPLFFSNGVSSETKKENKYDIIFIGTGHSDRVQIIELLRQQCNALELSSFFYLFLHNKWIFYFYKLIKRYLKNIGKKYFYYKPMSYEEYTEITDRANVIVDLEHPKQRGLTMRTFEVLGKEKKLLTTNNTIKEYDFYNETNICVLDRKISVIDKNFFKTKYKKISKQLYYKYSIDGWLEDIFVDE